MSNKRQKKYIVVTGGVLSSLGKGIVASSIGCLMEAAGYKVAAMKIDPYVNIDAGTMRPTEHGETYVTEDGFETDMDLGNYERFTSTTTFKENSVTTGQVYYEVIEDERAGKYEGRCVDVIPGIPLQVIKRIHQVADNNEAEIIIVEIGGTAGEYQIFPFLDATRRMRDQGEDVCFVHLGYLPIPAKVGEMKSKPLQRSIFDLLAVGILPDFVVGRSEYPLDDERKSKISANCSIPKEHVISSPDVDSIYSIPLVFTEQNFDKLLLKKLGLTNRDPNGMDKWKEIVDNAANAPDEIRIGVVGKYFDIGDFSLEDSYVSVIESVKHAAWHHNRRPIIEWINSKDFEKDASSIKQLEKYDGIIIPGGFGTSGVEGKISAIQYARENKIPLLGLCYGLQLCVVEYARHAAGIKNAHTTEVDENTSDPIIHILPEQKKALDAGDFGASMRLGGYDATLKPKSIVAQLYGSEKVSERHRHRWEVNSDYEERLAEAGLVISGKNDERNLVEFIELPEDVHPYFVATQSHPEFKSKFISPSPLYTGLVKAASVRSGARK